LILTCEVQPRLCNLGKKRKGEHKEETFGKKTPKVRQRPGAEGGFGSGGKHYGRSEKKKWRGVPRDVQMWLGVRGGRAVLW